LKLFLVGSGNSHLIEEVTKVTELGTEQQHGVLRVQPDTEEHGGPCPELARERAQQCYIKFNVPTPIAKTILAPLQYILKTTICKGRLRIYLPVPKEERCKRRGM